MNEEVFAQGRLFELVQATQPDGRVFEVARRAPGVRLIIADTVNKKVLLTKEYRHELETWDFRLPGGKVFDSLDEFEAFRSSSQDINEAAKRQAIVEAKQEAGVEIFELELYKKSVLGATVEWDLHVFETSKWQFHIDGQELSDDEPQDIVGVEFYDYAEVKRMILDGQLQEERIALVLLQWLSKQ